MAKNPPAKQEMRVQSLGGEDPLEEEMTTHSSILARIVPWTEEPDKESGMTEHALAHMQHVGP